MPLPDSTPSGYLSWRDVRRIGLLAGGGIIAQFVPSRASPLATRILLRAYRLLLAQTVRGLEQKMSKALPVNAQPGPRAVAEQHVLMRLEDIWGRLRGMRRFGWHPHIEWEGLERLDGALLEGRGILLWSMRFSSATALKQAFYRQDKPFVHLSRVDHGSSTQTTVGLRIAAPFYCRAENCYLKERIRIPVDGSLHYVQTLRQRLRAGDLVSIFGEHAGRQNYETQLLGTTINLALGAPSLAWLEDAALFTIAPIRVGPFHYRIVVDEAIPVDRTQPRRQFAEQAAQEYARRLKARILKHPADWQGWLYRQF